MSILDRLSGFFKKDPLEAEYQAYLEKKYEEHLALMCGTGAVEDLDYWFDLALFTSETPVKRHRTLEKKKECHIFMNVRYCYSNHPIIKSRKTKKWGTSP